MNNTVLTTDTEDKNVGVSSIIILELRLLKKNIIVKTNSGQGLIKNPIRD